MNLTMRSRFVTTRSVILVVILVLFSLVLAACSDNATPTTTSVSTTIAASTSVAAASATPNSAGTTVAATTGGNSNQPITIRIGTGDSGDGLTPYNESIALFEKANPNIHIEVESITSSDYYGTLLTEAASGKAPDLIFVGDDEVADFVKKGIFENLTPYITGATGGSKLDTSVFYPNVLQPGQQNGNQYAIPKDFTSICVYYNKAMFKAAGLPEPSDGWTWNDFLNDAQKLTLKDSSGKVTQYGVQLTGAWPRGFEAMVFSYGGKLISPDGSHYEGFMDSAAANQALQFYSDLYNKYQVAPVPTDINSPQGGNTNFQDGTAAMQIDGHWPQASYLKNPKLKDVLGVAPLPKGAVQANAIAWGGFGVYAQSSHKTEAWKVLNFFVSPQGGGQYFKDWGLTPLQPIATQQNNPLDKVWLDQTQYFQPLTANFTPYWNSAGANELQEALVKVITDHTADAATVLKQEAAKADAELQAKLQSAK